MPVVTLDNTKIHFQELNPDAEETILMAHGMFGNLSVYYFAIAPILAQHYHVVMYDLRGHGKSERHTEGYDLHSMAMDLKQLTDQLDISKAHLVGYSYGGLITLKFATLFPEMVEKIAVVDAPDLTEVSGSTFSEVYQREFLDPFMDKYNTANGENLLGKRQLKRSKENYEFLVKETTVKADLEGEMHFMDCAALKNLSHEALLLYGTQSSFIKAGAKLKGILPDAQLVYLEGGHSLPMLFPKEIARELLSFIDTSVVEETLLLERV